MPRFKVQGRHYMTNKKHTVIYDADDKSQAEKRGLDDGLLVEKTTLIEDETDDGKKIDAERKFLDNNTNNSDENIEKPFQQRLNAVRIERKKSYISALLTVIIILFVIGFFGTNNKNKNHSQSSSSATPTTPRTAYVAPTTPKTAEQIRKERIERCFSAWDGSHRGLERLIKKEMNDPDSYKHVETVYGDKGDYLIVKTTFRGKNKFGGVVKDWVEAKADLDGNIIEIISQGP
jgi:hypothetical protein